MKETWRGIPDFPSYRVSDLGRVINLETGREMGRAVNRQDIVHVGLYEDGYQQRRSVALLVAKAFVDQPRLHFDTPIHLDGDRSNCKASNLMWRPRWFAIAYHKQMKRGSRFWSQEPIVDLETEIIYDTMWDAATTLGLLEADIFSSVTNWSNVAPFGQQFRFLEEVERLDISTRKKRVL